MNSTKLLLCVTLVVLGVAYASAKCGTCWPADCDPDDIEECDQGTVMDSCNCCKECAKVLGDDCGGEPGTSLAGTCAEGLVCEKRGKDAKSRCFYKE